MKLLVGLVAALVLADLAVAGVLVGERLRSNLAPSAAKPSAQAAGHPCNHGFYVSQAAHAKKGGKSVSGAAHSGLGKNGSCSAQLPA